MSEEALKLFEDMTTLGVSLLSWIDTHLNEASREKLNAQGIGNLKDTLGRDRTMMRILHYPSYDASTVTPGQVRAAAHEDINWITVLPAGSTPGLQLCLDGENWIDVPFEPDSIIVNIGDMLQELTGGQYRSTTHRVITSGPAGVERMSVPCFVHAAADIVLSERDGKPFTAKNYLDQRLEQLARLDKARAA